MKIYLVRHGQSEANVSDNHNLAQTPLTEIGRIQAERTANFFRGKKVCKIFSSDLRRARETAEKISEATSVPVTFLEELREIKKGIFEGKPRIEEEKAIKESGKDPFRFKPEGGESYYDFYNRVSNFIERLKTNNFKGDIIIVSHGGFIALFLLLLLNLPLEEKRYFGVKNCSVSFLEIDDRWRVKDFKVNDTTHLISQSPEFLAKKKKF